MRRSLWVFLAIAPMVFCGQAGADDREHWIPDSATVTRIENYAKTHMPLRNEADKAGPLSSYARFYTGITLKGRRTVVGANIRSHTHPEYPIGVHVVPRDKVPVFLDGGRSHIGIWYDVLSARVIQIARHGVA